MRVVIAAICAFFLALAGCENKPVFNALDITGIQGYSNDFRLTDHHGQPRTMADFRGKVVVIFFWLYAMPGCLSHHAIGNAAGDANAGQGCPAAAGAIRDG